MIAVAYVVDELLRRPAWRELAIAYLGWRRGRRPDLPAGVRAADAGLVRQRRARPAAVELRLQVPGPADGNRRSSFAGSLKLVGGLVLAAAAAGFALMGGDC